MIVRPSFKRCMAQGYWSLMPATIAILLIVNGADLIAGRRMHLLDMDFGTWLFFAVLPSLVGLAFLAITWPFACTIAPDGLRGRGRWGRRVFLRWRDIDVVEPKFGDFGGVRPGNSRTGDRVTLQLMDADLPRIHAELAKHAGTDHSLTQVFDPDTPLQEWPGAKKLRDPKALRNWHRVLGIALALIAALFSTVQILGMLWAFSREHETLGVLVVVGFYAAVLAASIWLLMRFVRARTVD